MIGFSPTVIVEGTLYDENMNIKQRFVKHNLITNAGYKFLADCMGNSTRPAALKYIAVGTSTTAPALADTALKAEKFRKACSYSYVSGNKYLSLEVTLNPGEATAALTEAGILTASSGGILFDRVTYPVINKDALDTYVVSFKITMSETTVTA